MDKDFDAINTVTKYLNGKKSVHKTIAITDALNNDILEYIGKKNLSYTRFIEMSCLQTLKSDGK